MRPSFVLSTHELHNGQLSHCTPILTLAPLTNGSPLPHLQEQRQLNAELKRMEMQMEGGGPLSAD